MGGKALFAVSWNWLLQGDLDRGQVQDALRHVWLGERPPHNSRLTLAAHSLPRPLPFTLQQPVPVHSKQRC